MNANENRLNVKTKIVLILLALMATVLTPCTTTGQKSFYNGSDDLEVGFTDPPHSAGIRAFWWWLNGNVTKEAITRDLEEMKDKGFNGALIFDADGSSHRGNNRVPAGPLFGSDEWTELFVHACKEARRLDLELSLSIQSGWNLGGPNVSAKEATQTLVWSKTDITGPAKIKQGLEIPKFNVFYRDAAVIAVPIPSEDISDSKVSCSIEASSTQKSYVAALAVDGDPDTFWVSNVGPSKDKPEWLLLKLSKTTEISGLIMQGRKGYGPRQCSIQVSMDGKAFGTIIEISLEDGKRTNVSFSKQQAKFIRLNITSSYDSGSAAGKAPNVQVAEIGLPGITAGSSGGMKIRPIKDLNFKSSTRELGSSAPDCRFLLETYPAMPDEVAVNSKDIVNLTAKMDKAGTLRWNVPKGKWQILRFGHTATGAHVSTCSAGWSGRVLDYMNPDSLDAYWDRNIDPLFKAIGPMAGTTMRYIHTDSWEGGGMNWTPGFDRTFKKNRGYDPLVWLAVIAGYVVDSHEESNAFLADFRKTIGDRVADHYGQLAQLAQKYGMGTHPESAGPHAGPMDGLKNYGRGELMMSEFWSPSPHRPTPDARFFVKQASSAAHTYGKRLVGAEAFTTIGPHWNDVPWSAMKPSFDHEFCAGLNLVFNHTFTCSPKEMGMPGQEYFAGTHFNPQITWWQEAPAFIDYMKRCQYLAQQGDFVADVVYYYGDHIPNIARRKGDDPAGALPGFDYDVLSEELLLESLTVKNGRLSLPSGMEYRVLVLPDHKILSLGALKKIDKLVRAGATVLGPKPLKAVSLEGGVKGKKLFGKLADGLWEQSTGEPGSRKVGKGRVAWGMAARELLQGDGIASDVTFHGADKVSGMDWIHYRIDDADIYFVSELEGKARCVNAIFRVDGRIPELWDAVDGSVRQANTFKFVKGRTHVPLEFDPYGSIFVVFRKKTKSGRSDGPNFPVWQQKQLISGPWDVSFDARWGGPKKSIRFDTLTDWIGHSDDGIKYYSGKAVYRRTFNIDSDLAGKSLAIELGKVKDIGIARVKLNGTNLGVVWRPPFRADISKAVKGGENKLEVTVVNSWRNRLIGDNKLPEDKRLTSTNIKVLDRTVSRRQTKWELEESGLLGPVRIVEMVTGK
jgi:hypothetical protein